MSYFKYLWKEYSILPIIPRAIIRYSDTILKKFWESLTSTNTNWYIKFDFGIFRTNKKKFKETKFLKIACFDLEETLKNMSWG